MTDTNNKGWKFYFSTYPKDLSLSKEKIGKENHFTRISHREFSNSFPISSKITTNAEFPIGNPYKMFFVTKNEKIEN